MVDDIAQTAKGANKLMNSPDLSNAVVNLNLALQDMQRFITNAESLVGKVNRKVDSVTESFESTLDDTRNMVRNIDRRVDPIASDMQSALAAIQASFDKAENLLVGAQKLISENSKLGREISVTLESMSDASRSLEELTDYLQQHPESIITGKQ